MCCIISDLFSAKCCLVNVILSFSVQVITFFLNCALNVTTYPSRIKGEYITGDLSVTALPLHVLLLLQTMIVKSN
jgi:hypothetical protein